MPTKLSHIKSGANLLNNGSEFGRGESFSFGYKDNILHFLNNNEGVNFDLTKCSIQNLDSIIDVLRAYKREITQEKSGKIQNFSDIEHGLQGKSKIGQGLILFLGRIMASLRIALQDKKVVLNPLQNIKKQQEQEKLISGILQGMFFGLIKKLKSMNKQEQDAIKKEKYGELISTCYSIIRIIGSSNEASDNQISSLS